MWLHWSKGYHRWVPCPGCPSDSSNPANHHLNDLYCPELLQDHPAHEDWMCYCIHIRVTLGKGGGNEPLPSHAWSGLLIADMFQEGLEEWIIKTVVLAPGRQSYSLDDDHSKKGSPWEMPGMSDSA